jgi:nicotinamide mononucleotide (NMN) deamidase PncC
MRSPFRSNLADHRSPRVQEFGRVLSGQGQTMAVAESLTGGLLVQDMARAEGSSKWLRGGVVA